MGYHIGGWADFPVELRFIHEHPDQYGDFLRGLQDPLLMGRVSVKNGSSAREALGGVVAGQMEHTTWVQVSTPADQLQMVMGGLVELCNRVFPRVRGNDGEGPTASY